MVRDGSVNLDEPFGNVYDLYFAETLQLLLHILIDLLDLLAQRIRLMTTR